MDQEAVDQFQAITGADAQAAAFYLEGAGGDLEAAMDNFYAGGGQINEVAEEPEEGPPVPAVAAPAAAPAAPPGGSGLGAGGGGFGGGGSGRPPARVGNVRSLADLGGDGDDEESDDEDMNEYYAGGEKSGQVVKGPKGDRGNGGEGFDGVQGLFDRARQHGAADGTAEDLRPRGGGTTASGSGAFSGRARTLAGAPEAEAGASASEDAAADAPPAAIVHTITFYRNGIFTVDDGPPRSVGDPANAPFIKSISVGECPAELEPADRNQAITVNMLRRDADYEAPQQPRYTAFSGAGRTLAGDTPAEAPSSSAAAAPAATTSAPPASSIDWEGPDESQPTTSIQIRLHDGSRLVAKFNLSHTVGDIRRFIRVSRPDTPPAYTLMTLFPSQPLADDAATIAAAGLQNAVIVQKL